ncbi:uroporphyrinogen-III synthase [Actinoalloteichus caeruleus]|uniref:uroporphyrinogen-III synthase n=1 Tax=Actinoalloteichus cyanogriseus TaxID=2893586 RepID=UPI001FDFD3EB
MTAARRAEELGALLERRGAQVVHAPAIRIVPLADDADLVAATRRCLSGRLDAVVATTGIGFRGWVEAADGWGLGDRLIDRLRGARLLARGPKARGAVRAAGLPDAWSPASESSGEVLARLLAEGVAGARIAVQLHGQPLPHFVDALRGAGAEVIEIPVYRWTRPVDVEPLRRLVTLACAGEVDALTFTSAPAAASTLSTAAEMGRQRDLLAALRGRVLVACVGPVTRAPLEDHDVPAVMPERYRLGALVRELADGLAARSPRLPVAGTELWLRGRAVVLGGALRPVPPSAMCLLRVLARRPGRVVPRGELVDALRTAPGGSQDIDEHAVETAMTRLRAALGRADVIQTVIKRGYRLSYDPLQDAPRCPGGAAERPGARR